MNWTLKELLTHCNSMAEEYQPGKWRPCRPLQPSWLNWRGAWAVLRNKADALFWYSR